MTRPGDNLLWAELDFSTERTLWLFRALTGAPDRESPGFWRRLWTRLFWRPLNLAERK